LKIISFIGVPKQKNLTLDDDTSVSKRDEESSKE